MIDIRAFSKDLELDDNGVWSSTIHTKINYPSDGNSACFAIEEDSFWFKHRNNCIREIVTSFPPRDNKLIFDIGGGNGFVSQGLAKAGFNLVLVEPGTDGVINAQKRGIKHIIRATLETANFRNESLPAVGLFDVLEHIEKDTDYLKKINILMNKNGLLYITVPSYLWLWSGDDIIAGHKRRYTLRELERKIKQAGFDILYSSYIFRFIPLPIFFFRTLPYLFTRSAERRFRKSASLDHKTKNKITEKILTIMLESETNKISKGKKMLFGGSCLIVGQKEY